MDMESRKTSTPNDPLIPDHNSSSTTRRKKRLILMVVLILCFTLIIAAIISVLAVLKHQIDAESPAKNPALALRSACSYLRGSDSWGYCWNTLSPLRDASETNPTEIFTLSVRAAVGAFTELAALPDSTFPEAQSTLNRSCGFVFNETLGQLRVASSGLAVDSVAAVRNLTAWLSTEGYEVRWCLNLLEWSMKAEKGKVYESSMYASSSLAILGRANEISEMFYPAIKSTVASFLGNGHRPFAVCVFALPHLYLILLFCILLRLTR